MLGGMRTPGVLSPDDRPLWIDRIEAGDVVAADLEGTLTAGRAWRAVGTWLVEHGRRAAYRRFLAPRLAAFPLVRVGLIDAQAFRDRWIRDLAGLLAGMRGDEVDALAGWVVDAELWPKRRSMILAELAAASAAGARVVIASGTYQPVAEHFAARLGAETVATPLAFLEGRATGRLAEPVATGERKAAGLRRRIGTARLVSAYGDSMADIPVLEASEVPVAVVPDRRLRRVAEARGWRIMEAMNQGPR